MRPPSIPSVVLRGTIHKNKDLPRNDMNKALHLVSTQIQNNELLVDSKPQCPSRPRSTSSHITENVVRRKNHNVQTEITLNRNFHRKAKPNSKMKSFTEGPPFPISSNCDKNHGDYVYNEIWASKRRYSFSTDILFSDTSSKDNQSKVAQDWPEDLLTNWNGNVQISLDDNLKSGLTADSVIKEFQSEASVKNKNDASSSKNAASSSNNAASSSKNRINNKNIKKSKSKRSLSKQLKVVEKRSVNYYMKKTLENNPTYKISKNDRSADKRTAAMSPFKLKPCSIPHKSRTLKKGDENSVASTSNKYNTQSPKKLKVKNIEGTNSLDTTTKVNNIEGKDAFLKTDIAHSKCEMQRKSEDIEVEKASHIIVLNEFKTCSNISNSNVPQDYEKVNDKNLEQTDMLTLESNVQIISDRDVPLEPLIMIDQKNITLTKTSNKEIMQDSFACESNKNISSKLSPEDNIHQSYESISSIVENCGQKLDKHNLQLLASSNQYESQLSGKVNNKTKSQQVLSEFPVISDSDNSTPAILPGLKFSNFDISENVSPTNLHSEQKIASCSEIPVKASSASNDFQNKSLVVLNSKKALSESDSTKVVSTQEIVPIKASPGTNVKKTISENYSPQSVTNENILNPGENVSNMLPPNYLTTISSQIEQLEYILSNDVKMVSSSEIDNLPEATTDLELSMMESDAEILPNSEQSMQEFLNRKVYCVPNFNTDVFTPDVGADFMETTDLSCKNSLPIDDPKVVPTSGNDFLQGSSFTANDVSKLGMQKTLPEDNSNILVNLPQVSSLEVKVFSTNNNDASTNTDKKNSSKVESPKPQKKPANNVKKKTSLLTLKTKITEKLKEKSHQKLSNLTADKENISKHDKSHNIISTSIEDSIKRYLAAVDVKMKLAEEDNLQRFNLNKLSNMVDENKKSSLLTLQKENSSNVPLESSLLKKDESPEKDVPLIPSLLKKDESPEKEVALTPSLLKKDESPEKDVPLKTSLLKRDESSEKDVPLKSSLLKRDESSEKDVPLKTSLLKRDESSEKDVPLKTSVLKKDESSAKDVPLKSSLLEKETSKKDVPLKSSLLEKETSKKDVPLKSFLLKKDETPVEVIHLKSSLIEKDKPSEKEVSLKSSLLKKDESSAKDVSLKSSMLKKDETPNKILHIKSSLIKKDEPSEKEVPLKSSFIKRYETSSEKDKVAPLKSSLLKKDKSSAKDIPLKSSLLKRDPTSEKVIPLKSSLIKKYEDNSIKNNLSTDLKIVSTLKNIKGLSIEDKEETVIPASRGMISKINNKKIIIRDDNLLMESPLSTSLKTTTSDEDTKNNLKSIHSGVSSKPQKSLPSIYLKVFCPYEKESFTSAEVPKEKVVLTSTIKKTDSPTDMKKETKTYYEEMKSSFEKKLLNKSQNSMKLKKQSLFKDIIRDEYSLNSSKPCISKSSPVTDLTGNLTVGNDNQNTNYIESNLTKKGLNFNEDINKDKKLLDLKKNYNLSKSTHLDTNLKISTNKNGNTETSTLSSYEKTFASQIDERVKNEDLFDDFRNTSSNKPLSHLSDKSLDRKDCLLSECKSSKNIIDVCHPYQKFLDVASSDYIVDSPKEEIDSQFLSGNVNRLRLSYNAVISQTIENNIPNNVSQSLLNSKITLSPDKEKKSLGNEIKSILSDGEGKFIHSKKITILPERTIKEENKLSNVKDNKIPKVSSNKSNQSPFLKSPLDNITYNQNIKGNNNKSKINKNPITQNKNQSFFDTVQNSFSPHDKSMRLLVSSLNKSPAPSDNKISALSCLKSPFSRKAKLSTTTSNLNASSYEPKRIKGLSKKEALSLISQIGQNSMALNQKSLKVVKNNNFERGNSSVVNSNKELKEKNDDFGKNMLGSDLKSSNVDKSLLLENISKIVEDVIPDIDKKSMFYCEEKTSKTIKAPPQNSSSLVIDNSNNVEWNYNSEARTVSKVCDSSYFDDKSGQSSNAWETNNSEKVDDIFDNPYHMTTCNYTISNQNDGHTYFLDKFNEELNLDKKPESYLVVSKTPSPNSEISLLEQTNLIMNNCLKDLNSNPVAGQVFSDEKNMINSIEKKISLSIELINHSSNCKKALDSLSCQKIFDKNNFKDIDESKISFDIDRNVNVVFDNGILSMVNNQASVEMDSNNKHFKSSDASHKKSCSEKVDMKKLKSTKLNEKEVAGVLKKYCKVRANSVRNSHEDADDLKVDPSVPSDLMRSLLWKYKRISEKMMVNETIKYRVRATSTRQKGYYRVRTKSSNSTNYYRVRAESDKFNDKKDKFEPTEKNNVTNKSKICSDGSGDTSSKKANEISNSTSFIDPNIWKYVLLFRSIPLKMKKNEKDTTDIQELPDVSKRSILDLFRSVEKSAVIIQKDFYTREKIMKRIKDEENKLKKPMSTPIDKTVKAKQMDVEKITEQKEVIDKNESQNVSYYTSNVDIGRESKNKLDKLGNNTSTDSVNPDMNVSASQNQFKFLRYDAFFSKALDPNATEAHSDASNNKFFANYPTIAVPSINSDLSENKLLRKRRNIYKNIVVYNSANQTESVEGFYMNYRDNVDESNGNNHINSAASTNNDNSSEVNNKSVYDGIKIFDVTSINVAGKSNSDQHVSGSSVNFDVSGHADTIEGIVEPLYSEHALVEPSVSYTVKQSPNSEHVGPKTEHGIVQKKESANSEHKFKPKTSEHELPKHGLFHTIYSQPSLPKHAHSEQFVSKTDPFTPEKLPKPSEKTPKLSEKITSSPVQNTTLSEQTTDPSAPGMSNTNVSTSPLHVSPEHVSDQEASSEPVLPQTHIIEKHNEAGDGDFMNQPMLNETINFLKNEFYKNNSGNLLIKLKEDGNDALDISSCDVTFYENPNKGFSILLSDDNIDIDIASLIKANDPNSTKEIVAKDGAKDLTTKDDNFIVKETRKPPSSFPFPQTTSTTSINLRTIDAKTEVSVAQNSNTLEPGSSIPSVVKSYFQMSGCSAKLRDQASIVEKAQKNLMGLGGITDFEPISKITGKANMLNISSGDSPSINNLKISSGAYSVIDSKKENETGPTNAKREYELSSSTYTDDIKPVVTVSNDYPVINIQLQLAGKGLKTNTPKDPAQEDVKLKTPPPNQTDSYEDTIEKMRKKFIANTFRPDSSVAVNRLNPKVDDPKVPKTLQDEEEKKPKIDNFEYDPNSNPLNEKDLKLLENYFYSKNNPNKKSSVSKVKKSSKYSLGKGKGISGKKSKIDSSSQIVDSVSKFKELIEKYANDNYMELSQYTFSVVSPSEFANAPRPSSLNKVTPIADVSEQTIASFSILKRDDKESGFTQPIQGIINIDLLANPILKEKFATVPSVSRILNDTMSEASRTALDKWKMRMITLMGETVFQDFYQAQLDQGKGFHESVKGQLMGRTDLSEKHKDNLCLKSIEWVLKDISDVAAVESFVVHPSLGYKGIFDCVAKYKEKPVLIEWKHSSKKKSKLSSTYDAPLQMTAYMGALSEDKNYNLQVDSGLVVVAHADGSPAELFEINVEDCQKFWTLWLKRLSHFVANYRQKTPTS